MRDMNTIKECELVLKEFQTKNPEKLILMIDGQTIELFMKEKKLED